jgi:serine/threonine protein kinase/tetratricopeptide (TPR) repeat protein
MDRESAFGAEPEQLRELLSFGLEDSSEQADALTASLGAVLERPGGQIGRYKLLSILGEGGMGIVYLAEQKEPIKRRVALKVIKPGMDSSRVIARFEAERQALALLDHPNIAHVHDAGTTQAGRPYFVMEYVKGLPITEHCDKHKLTIEERLRLFQQLCDAVQHAHQKGIIHRDIKPSNILVCAEREKAIPKIIDFGVAKAIAQPLTERTLVTEHGQLFGTPEYMSPEQADVTNEDIDTRSDIYSLGVLLYVLLTGVLPFDSTTFREGGIEHIRRSIREEKPKTPSTRLTSLGEQATRIAEHRCIEVKTLVHCLHEELEWIPLKAMRKERARRYRSALELADDIQNYLQGIALIAGPESVIYRTRKFMRRNQALVTAISVVVFVVLLGIVGIIIFAFEAEQRRREAEAVSGLLRHGILASLDPYKVGGQDLAIRSVLDVTSKDLGEKLKDTPLAQAEIRHALGNAYWRLGMYDQAESHLRRAFDIRKNKQGPNHLATLASANDLGWVYYLQSRHREAEQLIRQACENRRQLLGDEHEDTLLSMGGLACVYILQGRFQEADKLLSNCLMTIRHVFGENNTYMVGLMNIQSQSYVGQGRYNEAERVIEKGLRVAHHAMGSHHWFTLLLKTAAANTYIHLGRYDEAEQFLKNIQNDWVQTWGKEHPDTLSTIGSLGWVYHEQKRYEKAESLLRETLSTVRRVLGDTHLTTADFLNKLGTVYLSQGRYDDAEPLLKEAVEIATKLMGEKNWVTLHAKSTLAKMYIAQGHFNDAEEVYLATVKIQRHVLGDEHPHTLTSIHGLALVYKEQGNYDEAEPLLFEALEGRRLKLGDTHPHTLESLNNLIDLYEAWNKPEEANQWQAKLAQMERAGK